MIFRLSDADPSGSSCPYAPTFPCLPKAGRHGAPDDGHTTPGFGNPKLDLHRVMAKQKALRYDAERF